MQRGDGVQRVPDKHRERDTPFPPAPIRATISCDPSLLPELKARSMMRFGHVVDEIEMSAVAFNCGPQPAIALLGGIVNGLAHVQGDLS